jgi:hypothetical protein
MTRTTPKDRRAAGHLQSREMQKHNEFGFELGILGNQRIGGRSNLCSNRKRKTKRFKRIGNGLFRYQKTGVIYGVFKAQRRTWQ